VLAVALRRGMDESCRSQRAWDTSTINGRPRKIVYLLVSTGRLTPDPGALPELGICSRNRNQRLGRSLT
jgi:hypothetical protein